MDENPWEYHKAYLAKLRKHLVEKYPAAMDATVTALLHLLEEDAADQLLIAKAHDCDALGHLRCSQYGRPESAAE